MDHILAIGDLSANGGRFADLITQTTAGAQWCHPDVASRVQVVQSYFDNIVKPVTVVAHGTGAYLALHHARSAPKRIKHLIVLDGPSALGNVHHDPIGAASRIDAGVERVRTLYADRTVATAALIDAGWLPATGMTRAFRKIMESEIVGSGFGWRSSLSEATVTQALFELAQFRPRWTTTVPTTIFRSAHGHRLTDPPIALALEPVNAITLDCTHDGLLWDEGAVRQIASVIDDSVTSNP